MGDQAQIEFLKLYGVRIWQPEIDLGDDCFLERDLKFIGLPQSLKDRKLFFLGSFSQTNSQKERWLEPLLGASVRIRNERPIRDDQPFTCSSTEVVLALAICCDFPFVAGLFENIRRDNSDYISSSPMISVLSGRKGRGDNFICEQTQDQLRLTLDYVRKTIRDLGWDSKGAQQLFYLMQVLRRDEYFFDSFLQYGVNHMFPVEAQRIFFCFQLLESAIDKEPRENWRDALARWMDVYEMILNFDEISLIVQKRHVLAHHDAGAAERKLIGIRERLKLAQNGSDDISFLDESIPAIARSIVRGIIGKYI